MWKRANYFCGEGSHNTNCEHKVIIGRIQIKVLTTWPFFFFGFFVSKDNIYKSKMYNPWRITISFQQKISISIMFKNLKHQRKQNPM